MPMKLGQVQRCRPLYRVLHAASLAALFASFGCITKNHARSNATALKDVPDPHAPRPDRSPSKADPEDDPNLAALPFPTLEKDDHGRGMIHVRIFPHPKGDPWTGGAEEKHHIVINGDCTEFAATKGKLEPAGKPSGPTKARYEYDAGSLSSPRYLKCPEPSKVERQGGLPQHAYEGNFYIHKIAGQVEVINIVSLEGYLRGVLPAEVVPSWPEEALKAQAVASRTYALYNIAHHQKNPEGKLYDVDDTSFYQAYAGVSAAAAGTDRAIQETNDLALTYTNRVILSFFCTDSGGFTESAEEVFGLKAPYCRAKKEGPGALGAKSAWTKSTTLAELSAKLAGSPEIDHAAIQSVKVEPKNKTASGRVRAVTASLQNGKTVDVPAPEFKKAAGLKSALFTLQTAGGKVEISGFGSGHGVGLSQIGAKQLAGGQHWDFARIVRFYYDGANLCTLSASDKHYPRCGAPAQTASLE